jgi:hypothetical protein
MIIILDRKITEDELAKAREDYEDYIKIVADVDKSILAVGGEFHIDAEEILIKSGSRQDSLYGGGYRPSTKAVEYMAMSNYKPALGKNTYEVMDEKVRNKLYKLVKEFLEL